MIYLLENGQLAETTAHLRTYFNTAYLTRMAQQYENMKDGAATIVNSGDGWVKLDSGDVQVTNVIQVN